MLQTFSLSQEIWSLGIIANLYFIVSFIQQLSSSFHFHISLLPNHQTGNAQNMQKTKALSQGP